MSLLRLLACLALCFAAAALGGLVTYPEIPTWYASRAKPGWTPPNAAVPSGWNLLYAMMAISLWLLWDRSPPGRSRSGAIALFLVQLALNAAWSPVFFALHQTRFALAIILALAVAIAATIARAWRINRAAALLLVPYLAWVLYASTLNAGIVALNP